MTKQEWLWHQVMSEAVEIAHAVSKVIQFGSHDNFAAYHNVTQVIDEINDLMGAIKALQNIEALPIILIDHGRIAAKLLKIENMYAYAKEKGIVSE